MRWWLVMVVLLCGAAYADEPVYPVEQWPASAGLISLDGTTDQATGIPHIARGTSPSSAISIEVWARRQFDRIARVVRHSNELRVVQEAALRIGVFPGDYFLGSRTSFLGATGVGEGDLDAGDDTYYVYISNANALTIVPDATDWPAEVGQFVPLAEIDVAGGAITEIRDRRNWARTVIGAGGGGGSETGTSGTTFTIDEDNEGAGVNVELRANRGSTGNASAWRWSATDSRWEAYLDTIAGTGAPIQGTILRSTVTTGTAPLAVTSTTVVPNLNADKVDGIDFAAVAAANRLAYSTAASTVGWVAAPASANVLYADGSGVPTWGARGTTSGVQAWDADLDAVAGVAATGLLARTAAGTASARTLTAGTGISVTDGDGVAGNPTVALSARTENAVQIGASGGGLAEVAASSDNTVLTGRSGNTPVFRKLVNADVSDSAVISVNKLSIGSGGMFLRADYDGVPFWSRAHFVQPAATRTLAAGEADRTFVLAGEDTGRVTMTLPTVASVGLGATFTFVHNATVTGDPEDSKLVIGASGSDLIGGQCISGAVYTPPHVWGAHGALYTYHRGAAVTILAASPGLWVVISCTGELCDGNADCNWWLDGP